MQRTERLADQIVVRIEPSVRSKLDDLAYERRTRVAILVRKYILAGLEREDGEGGR